MNSRATSMEQGFGGTSIGGLPPVNYRAPIVATLLASVFLLLVVGFITLITSLSAATQLSLMLNNSPSAATGTFGMCGFVALLGLASTIFFTVAVVKGARDLFSPVYYTRGTVADKRTVGMRKAGNWLVLNPEYAGPDPIVAGAVSSEQVAASVDRSRIVQTRSTGGSVKPLRPQSSYLSADRISLDEDTPAPDRRPRRVFRVEPTAHKAFETGEEVLVAHSRFLDHIYYVARLKDGEWDVYRNKALI